ncbi:hypothetical protein AQUCO_06300037v1 [Aquilegia coerulea]|uniref:AAA+ ATPase domain-containing protein n=1 Tax=Aquilegia coerulea TaxID=218851 RepID=A0A2G5CCR1_AQUCA|nr:hypothetical protein AQUCO_06300037v1 [Aquilegia coerulea]
MEGVATPATEAAKYTAAFLGPQIGYVVNYKKNVKNLSNKIDDLSSVKNDIEGKISAAKRRGELIYQAVERWLEKVDKILIEAGHVNDDASGIDSCFKGWCCGRYDLGKKASKTIIDVTELVNEGRSINEVSTPAPIQDFDLMPTDDFEAFESTRSAMDLVMKALVNDRISIIGVHGMGGIGKTTLMRKIGNQVKMNKLFDVVVMVSVSQNHDMKRIQEEIAEDLCLNFGQERGETRKRRLFSRLKQEMRVLIILDDMWSRLDLTEVGIPCGEHHMGCKVVLTTRRLDVCNMMKTQVNVRLECLSEPDSWHLFQKNAGAEVDSFVLGEVARDVAKECKGLPVALVTLGRAMRDKSLSVWENVLQQLRESDFTYIEDMDARVFQAIKLSYDYLPTDISKSIFLFCCLFPEDHKISVDDLLRYMMGEGLLKDVKLNQAKRKLDTVVDILISSHLLLKGDRDGYVLMHDVIRDVSIIIATRDHGFIVKAGRGLEAWPEQESLEKCLRFSLMGNELSDLPERPDCPKILTFSLSRCQSLENIPERFFEGMSSLLTLDLSHTPILSLPSSLACLENLRSLCLDGCTALQDVSLIGKLKNLEMISLKKTSIKMLPVKEIREFKSLKLLALES